jgi:hypothetical protein
MRSAVFTAQEVRTQAFRDYVRQESWRGLLAAERAECRRLRLPLPVRGGTSFGGGETLASMKTPPGAIGPFATPGKSILSPECLQPINPSYFDGTGKRFSIHAFGTITATAVIPTYVMQLLAGPTYANPLATNVVTLASNAAITPGAAAGTQNWMLDLMLAVRATGAAGTIIAYGFLTNEWATAGTFVMTPFRNANPPTAVAVAPSGSGLLLPIYFDLNEVLSAATAGNTINCLDYRLVSEN